MRLWKNAKSVKAVFAFVVGTAAIVSVSAAHAASCASLKSELSGLGAQSGKLPPAARKWKTSQQQQKKAIASAKRDANYFGCSSTSNAQCKSLNNKINRMQKNLAAIERQLAKTGGTSPKHTKRIREVRSAIAKQNCNSTRSRRDASAGPEQSGDKPRSLLARLFNPKSGTETEAANSSDRNPIKVKRSNSGRKRLRIPSGGTFRTLCVRTCDGFFFPVSYATGKNQFAYDASRCSEICPASETELYVYRNPGGDQADMMSLAGNIYSEQPFANKYKTEFVENCSCRQAGQVKRRSAWSEVRGTSASRSRVFFSDISSGLQGQPSQLDLTQSSAEATPDMSPLARQPLTRSQLPAYEDPDTLTNLEKGFNVTADLDLIASQKQKKTFSVSARATSHGLPVLTSRNAHDKDLPDERTIPPVFKVDDDGFSPAPDREAPVRVVGPEYFVAQ
ncbi:MAG: DUF2865 domain-containing protein [Roseibium sp.]